jgi:hypothetical protein
VYEPSAGTVTWPDTRTAPPPMAAESPLPQHLLDAAPGHALATLDVAQRPLGVWRAVEESFAVVERAVAMSVDPHCTGADDDRLNADRPRAAPWCVTAGLRSNSLTTEYLAPERTRPPASALPFVCPSPAARDESLSLCRIYGGEPLHALTGAAPLTYRLTAGEAGV